MKQELKEIVGYLPYGVKAYAKEVMPFRNGSYIKNGVYTLSIGNLSDIIDEGNLDKVKLILRPLSDLTEEVTVNGETFVPEARLYNLFGAIEINSFGCCHFVLDGWTEFKQLYLVIQKLYEWHFDIHNLIEQGKAVNLNDLEI